MAPVTCVDACVVEDGFKFEFVQNKNINDVEFVCMCSIFMDSNIGLYKIKYK